MSTLHTRVNNNNTESYCGVMLWRLCVGCCGGYVNKNYKKSELEKAGSAGSRLTEHFPILGISWNIQCQIPCIVSQFYIHNWNIVLEGDRNRNCKALTRNLPGIRYPGLVPGSPYFELPGSCFGSCLQPFSIFLVTPGS